MRWRLFAFLSEPSIRSTRLPRPGIGSYFVISTPGVRRYDSSVSTLLTSCPDAGVPSFTHSLRMRCCSRSVVSSVSVATRRLCHGWLLDLRAHFSGGLDDHPALVERLLDRSRLEPAVGMRQQPIGTHIAQSLADPFGSLIHRLEPVRVHIDDTDGELLCERILVEEIQPAVLVVVHREVELIDRELQHLWVDRREVAVADVRDGLRLEILGDDAHRFDSDVELLWPRVDRGLV